MRWRAELLLVLVCFVWGATFILVKDAVADIPILMFLALRFTMAAILLGAVMATRRNRPSWRASLRGGITVGTLLFLGYVLQTFGLRYTSAAKSAFITSLYVPLVPGLSAIIYRKIPRVSEIVGVTLAIAGLALLTVPSEVSRISSGDLLIACCAVAFALHIILLGRYAQETDVGWLATIQIAFAAVLGGATFWWAEPLHVRWTSTVWIALAITSVFATALGFLAQTWAQSQTSATRAALIYSLEPVFAWLTSYVFAGELLTARALAGAALVLSGILAVELKPFRRTEHQPLSGNLP
ncbi:MAG TPA: DMT family transporter [Bryobacteraceae bacterium]|nr:DMT family transporter [Bryobacteraceae bacterium]